MAISPELHSCSRSAQAANSNSQDPANERKVVSQLAQCTICPCSCFLLALFASILDRSLLLHLPRRFSDLA